MTKPSKYWLDEEITRIIRRYPSGEIVVSSGISPSANYHVGHLPEIIFAEMLVWGLRRVGRKAIHKHVVDNMDPLRRRYDFLPESYDKYVGWPICLVPSPEGEGSYADYFFLRFQSIFDLIGIAPDEIIRSYQDLYCTGKMTPAIEATAEHMPKIRDIFAKHGRELARDWTPFQVNHDNKFINARLEDWDKNAQTIAGVSYLDGGVKLTWRLDWPARWAVLGVQVEPFNLHEHGAASGSYDTGVDFAREIFNYEPPLAAAGYGNVHLPGDNTKMSSSKGNFITPQQALEIMPPGLLRYFIVRSRPEKTRYFDTGIKFANLYNEYKQVAAAVAENLDHEFAEAYEFAHLDEQLTIVPFEHLVAVYQAALRDATRTQEILVRSGYEVDLALLKAELVYVANWLDNYAPASVVFTLQIKLPQLKLSTQQTDFLSALAAALSSQTDPDAEWIHATIYQLKTEHDITTTEAFKALYQILLGQDFGPKAGWFLTSLDKTWLIKRLQLKT